MHSSGILSKCIEKRPTTSGVFNTAHTPTDIAVHDTKTKNNDLAVSCARVYIFVCFVASALKKGARTATLFSTSDVCSSPHAHRPCRSAPPTPRSSQPSGGRGMGLPNTSRQTSIVAALAPCTTTHDEKLRLNSISIN